MFAPIRALLAVRPRASPGVLGAAAAVAVIFAATPFLVPAVASAYGVALGTAGLISTAQVGGFAAAAFLSGRFLAPSRGLLLSSVAGLALVNASSAISVPFPTLLALRLMAGVLMGLVTWITWADAARHTRGIHEVAALGPLTAAVGSPIVAVIAQNWGYPGVYLALAGMCVVSLLLPTEVEHRTRVGTAVSPSRSNRVLLGSLFLATLFGSAMFVYAAAAGSRTGLSPLAVSLGFSLNAVAGIAATRLTESRAGRWLGLTALCAWATGVVPSPAVFLTALTLWGLGFWLALPAVFRLLAERSLRPDERVGDAQAVMAVGRMVGPAIGGVLLADGRFATLGWVSGAGLLIAATVVHAVERHRGVRASIP